MIIEDNSKHQERLKIIKEKFGDKLTLIKPNFSTISAKCEVICNICGYRTKANYKMLLRWKHHCPKCFHKELSKKKFLNIEEIKKNIETIINDENNPYDDYNLDNYIDTHHQINVHCSKHGWFHPTYKNFISGHGCYECGLEKTAEAKRISKEEILDRFSKVEGGDDFIYDLNNLKSTHDKIDITCKKCGYIFNRVLKSHLKSPTCPNCENYTILVKEIINFLEENNIEYIREKTFDWLYFNRNLYLDFFLPKYNIAIECQGLQHFEPINFFGGEEKFRKCRERDICKLEKCKEHDIKIIYYSKEKYSEFLGEKVYNDITEIINSLVFIFLKRIRY